MKANRLYLDYNSTSPLANKVKTLFASGDVPFSNPSSSHSSGKRVSKFIKDSDQYLKKLFSLPSDFSLIYHSGATEALNSFLKLTKNDVFVYSKTDHSAVITIASYLDKIGVATLALDVDNTGLLDIEKAILLINEIGQGKNVYLNYTWVNNETGVTNPLDAVVRIKSATNCIVHVDAVQSIGKIPNWKDLNSQLDMYTYSAHKFGALKGIGFSFFKSSFKLLPLIIGGGQQRDLRSGTINTTGIFSIKPALEEAMEQENYENNLNLKKKIINRLKEKFKNELFVVNAEDNNQNASNTICFAVKKYKSQELQIFFDINNIDISIGSACSSASSSHSYVLSAMGHDMFYDKAVRMSLGINSHLYAESILNRIDLVLSKIK